MDYKPRYFVERVLEPKSTCLYEETLLRENALQLAIRQAITKPTTVYASSRDAIDAAISGLPFTIDHVVLWINAEVARHIHYRKHWDAKIKVMGESQEEDSSVSFECDDFFHTPYHVFPYLPHAIVTGLSIDNDVDVPKNLIIFIVNIKFEVPDPPIY